MSKQRITVLAGLVLVIVIAAAAAFYALGPGGAQQVSTDDPGDVVQAFYQKWLGAAQSATTTPYKEGLANYPYLSKTLRAGIKAAQKTPDAVDPVLCQSETPSAIATRVVYQATDTAEFLVTASHSTSTQQADVKLLSLNGGWYMDSIACSAGEFAPVREFSFDQDGNLLKTDAKPLNPKYWYLVFTQGTEQGHYVPLFFSATSTCVALDGTSGACDPDTLMNTAKAHVQGQMTELGVEVQRVEMLK
jgi:hypothetical protein